MRLIDAFTQFFDDNGDPLVNGWIRFTESGTNNTDKDTFADFDETIANTNPLQLDGAGRCPNVFGSGTYNVRLYTDNGGVPDVQIQQFDPVGGDQTGGALSSWDALTIYSDGGLVTGPDGKYYRSIVSGNQNNEPSISASSWEEIQFLGVYNQNISYSIGDVVVDSNGFIYRSLIGLNINNAPVDNPDKWGAAVNGTDLEADTITHDMTSDADYTLSGAENRYGRLVITDTSVFLTTGRNIIVSDIQRQFIILNSTAQTLTFKTSAGTGIQVLSGVEQRLYCDGTNVTVGHQLQTSQYADGSVTYDKLSTEVGPWVKLATLDASTGTTVETATSLFSGYREIIIRGYVTHGSGTARDLYARFKNGASAITSANYQTVGVEKGTTLTGGTILGTTYFDLSVGTVATVTAGLFAPVVFHLRNLTDAYLSRAVSYKYHNDRSSNITGMTNGEAVLLTADTVDGIQFFWSGSVAFNGGQIEIWGHR